MKGNKYNYCLDIRFDIIQQYGKLNLIMFLLQEKLLKVFQTILEKSQVVSHHSVQFPVLACERSQKLVEEDFIESGSFDELSVRIPPLIKNLLFNQPKPEKSGE